MKRRVWLFRICCICILSIVLSGCKLIEAPPNLSTADVLRGPYEAPLPPSVAAIPDILRQPYEAPAVSVTAFAVVPDVLRGPYEAPVSLPVLALVDVLRGAYAAPPVLSAAPIAAIPDILRGPYEAPAMLAGVAAAVPVPDVLRGVYEAPAALPVPAGPIADVLRGPYEEATAPVAQLPTTIAAWIFFALALLALAFAVLEDYFWQRRHALPAPTGPPAVRHTH